jgi:pantothenate kinase
MEAKEVEKLAERADALLDKTQRRRVLVAVAGVPGSGKTTVCDRVVEVLNKKHGSGYASVVPMDGYHLTRAQLDQFHNPEEAHYRRGSPMTFDAYGVVDLAKRIRASAGNDHPEVIRAPSFDHKIKDPVANGVEIASSVRVVLMEGLYLLVNKEPWVRISEYADEKWLLTVDYDIAVERLAKRHFAAGITASVEDGRVRAQGNDAINGRYILDNSVTPDIVLTSG